MSLDVSKLIKASVLIAFTVLFAIVAFSNRIYMLVAPNVATIVKVSVFVFATLAVVTFVKSFKKPSQEKTCNHHREHLTSASRTWQAVTTVLSCFAVIVGLIWHPEAIGVSMFAHSGSGNGRSSLRGTVTESSQPQLESIYTAANPKPGNASAMTAYYASQGIAVQGSSEVSESSLAADYVDNPERWMGRPVSLIGFVYNPTEAKNSDFILARFFVFCCIADAEPVGVAVEPPSKARYGNNTWVRVTGFIEEQDLPWLTSYSPTSWYTGAASQAPIIIARTVTPISQPKMPYLVPTL